MFSFPSPVSLPKKILHLTRLGFGGNDRIDDVIIDA